MLVSLQANRKQNFVLKKIAEDQILMWGKTENRDELPIKTVFIFLFLYVLYTYMYFNGLHFWSNYLCYWILVVTDVFTQCVEANKRMCKQHLATRLFSNAKNICISSNLSCFYTSYPTQTVPKVTFGCGRCTMKSRKNHWRVKITSKVLVLESSHS